MSRRQHFRARAPLRLLQINVGRGEHTQELALATAFQEKIDILLVQEPYIFRELPRQITRRHPSYECFSPTDNWSQRPRVLTYLRKGVGLKAEQLRPFEPHNPASRDLLFMSLTSPAGQKVLITNVYNAPFGALDEQVASKALMELPPTFFPPLSILAGDFNLHHHHWQPSFSSSTSAAEPFVSWIDSLGFDLATSQLDIPTHSKGNVLDLALASNLLLELGTEAIVSPHLDVTSDHLPIQTWIPWDQRHREPLQRFHMSTFQPELFNTLLESKLQQLQAISEDPTPGELDKTASSLCTAIHQALQGSTQRTLGQNQGVCWWNQDCKEALKLEGLEGSFTEISWT